MNKKQTNIVLVVAFVAGLVGGMVSSWLLMGQPVLAEIEGAIPSVIKAQSFQVVDDTGKVYIELGGKSGNLVFFDKKGKAYGHALPAEFNEVVGK